MATLLAGIAWAQPAMLESRKAAADVELTADPDAAFWRGVPGIAIETDYSGNPVANHRTEVRSRWTAGNVYLLYACRYDELNLKPEPSTSTETNRLWNWDVAEAFLGSDLATLHATKSSRCHHKGNGSTWILTVAPRSEVEALHGILAFR